MNPLLIIVGLVLTGAGIAAKNPAEKSREKVLTKNDNSIIKEVEPLSSEVKPDDDSKAIDSTSNGGDNNVSDLDINNEPE